MTKNFKRDWSWEAFRSVQSLDGRWTRVLLLSSALGTFLWSGCQRNPEVQVYEVPKEAPQVVSSSPHSGGGGMGGAPAAGGGIPQVGYNLPGNWQRSENQAASRLRISTFMVSDESGQQAEVAIIPLPEMPGKELEFVNLWRDQVELSAITAEEFASHVEEIPVGDTTGKLFFLKSEKPLIEDRFPAAIMVAMTAHEGWQWFVKMTGPAPLVEAERTNFLKFNQSIDFHAEPQMASAPARPMSAPPAMGNAGNTDNPQWTLPAGWKEQPSGSMVRATFLARSEGGSEQALITVSAFPGDVGGLLANVHRWRRQLGLPTADDEEVMKAVTSLNLPSGAGFLIDLSNEAAPSGPQNTLALIQSHDGMSWFYKMTGDQAKVESERENFTEFLNSIRYGNE